MEVQLNRKKKRLTKRIYLNREIQELWSRIEPTQSLSVNKTRAHCLGQHDADFSFSQVVNALWAFFGQINKSNGKDNITAAIPDRQDGRVSGFIKIGNDPKSRILLEEERKRMFFKDGKRLQTHKEYMDGDKEKGLMPERVFNEILKAAGLSPFIKSLPAYKE
jgi:hypothetical protein